MDVNGSSTNVAFALAFEGCPGSGTSSGSQEGSARGQSCPQIEVEPESSCGYEPSRITEHFLRRKDILVWFPGSTEQQRGRITPQVTTKRVSFTQTRLLGHATQTTDRKHVETPQSVSVKLSFSETRGHEKMHGDCEHDQHTGAILKTHADHLEVMTPPALRTTLNPLQTMRYSLLFPEKSFSIVLARFL